MKTIHISELSTIKMVGGNEQKHPKVIHNGVLKQWVGFGWVEEGFATSKDRKKYPTVVTEF